MKLLQPVTDSACKEYYVDANSEVIDPCVYADLLTRTITALTGAGDDALANVLTADVPLLTALVLNIGGAVKVYQLTSGTDAQSLPDIVRPVDYGALNQRVWKFVPVSVGDFSIAWENITDAPETFPPSTHTHAGLPTIGTEAERLAIASPSSGQQFEQTDGTPPGRWVFRVSAWIPPTAVFCGGHWYARTVTMQSWGIEEATDKDNPII